MIKLNFLLKLITTSYIFFYLISSRLAICEDKYKDFLINIEKDLNQKNFVAIEKYFDKEEKVKFKSKFSKFIEEFPNVRWEIIESKSRNLNDQILYLKTYGSKNLNGQKLKFESYFNFLFSFENGIIKNSFIKNNLTTIRNDNNLVDIDISIPNKVLTGSNYDIDIILNSPLDGTIIAGGIKEYQEVELFDQSIKLEPLATGGIFKVTRAPIKPGIQIWTGIIAHPKGLISFTKSVDIIEKFETNNH
tara:strand:+ start:4815 stop:5555 length:741 start_codon:yes stop_codon:yes gene_type:complete